MKIIGLSGTNGAGKDAVAEILAADYGYFFVGATEMFLGELKTRGWPTDREHKSRLSAEWRREFGMGVIVDKAVAEFEKAGGHYTGLVVSSLRHPGEADRVHELGGKIFWVDADPRVRYGRIHTVNRGRPAEDDISYDEFLAQEAAEMKTSGDAATLNMSGVKRLADQTILNNGDNLDELRQLVRRALGE